MRVDLGDQTEGPAPRLAVPRRLPVLALLAKDAAGYANLMRLTSRA